MLKYTFGQHSVSAQGSMTTEVAVLMPILILLLIGGIELSWSVYTRQVMTMAAREAGRHAITANATMGSTQAQAMAILNDANIPCHDCLAIYPAPDTATPGVDNITVTITIDEADYALTGFGFAPNTLSATTTMRKKPT